MKNLLFLICLLSLISCSNDAIEDPAKKETLIDAPNQRWQLVKMTNSWTNSVTTGNDMAWQEYLIFNSDGTFLKSRKRDGVTTEVSGTYRYEKGKDFAETLFLSLTYTSQNDLISSCFSRELSESLIVNSDKTLSGTWNMCDGPGLVYELVK